MASGRGLTATELWQPLSWMGSAYRAVSDPTVHFDYAVNPFMVGNLSDTPFDGQSAILAAGLRGHGCHYVGDGAVVPARPPAPRVRGLQAPVPRARAVGRARRARGRRCGRSGRRWRPARPVPLRSDRADRGPAVSRLTATRRGCDVAGR